MSPQPTDDAHPRSDARPPTPPRPAGPPAAFRMAVGTGLRAGLVFGLVDGVLAGLATGTHGAGTWARCLAGSVAVSTSVAIVLAISILPIVLLGLGGRRPRVRARAIGALVFGPLLFLELYWWTRELVFYGIPATDARRLAAAALMFVVALGLGALVGWLFERLPTVVRRGAAVLAALVAIGGAASIWTDGADDRRGLIGERNAELPNVLLFVVDALRQDTLGAYGSDVVASPVVDALARRGVLFEDAFVQAPFTWTSFGSLLTGKYPRRHGLVKMAPGLRMAPNITLPWHLKQAEFVDAAGQPTGTALGPDDYFGGTFMTGTLSNGSGLMRGFDVYFEALKGHELTDNASAWSVFRSELLVYIVKNKIGQKLDESTVASVARTWLRENADRRFVAMVHYYSTHTPYDPPARFQEPYVDPSYDGPLKNGFYAGHRIAIESGEYELTPADVAQIQALYYAGVAQADAMIGEVLDELEAAGVLDDTIVVVTSDHGEELGDHGLWEHNFMYQTNLRIPLVMAGPGLPANRRVRGIVDSIDVVPTVCDLIGIALPFEESPDGRGRIDGTSLVPLARGEVQRVREHSFAENGRYVSVQSERFKLIVRAAALELSDGWEQIVDGAIEEAALLRPRARSGRARERVRSRPDRGPRALGRARRVGCLDAGAAQRDRRVRPGSRGRAAVRGARLHRNDRRGRRRASGREPVTAGEELVLVANARMPSQRAQSLQLAHAAASFARAGVPTRLLCARRFPTPRLPDGQDLFDYYDVEPGPRPEVVAIPCVDWIDRVPTRWQYGPARLQEWTFARNAARAIPTGAGKRPVRVLTREVECGAALARRRHPSLFLEIHRVPGGRLRRRWLRQAASGARGVIAISGGVRDDLAQSGVDAARILVEHDAVSADRLERLPERGAARERLGVGADAFVVVYTGGLLAWKGVDLLVDAARTLGDLEFVIAGGMDADVERLRAHARGAPNVRIDGFQPPARVADYLAAADVGVVPNRSRPAISARYTSPLKVFEAMGAGLPLVVSDLPSLRDILTPERDAVFVAPDDAAALATGIRRLAADDELRRTIRGNVRARAREHTWDARARADPRLDGESLMRVLYLTDSLSDLDGVGRYSMRLIDGIQKLDPAVEAEVPLGAQAPPDVGRGRRSLANSCDAAAGLFLLHEPGAVRREPGAVGHEEPRGGAPRRSDPRHQGLSAQPDRRAVGAPREEAVRRDRARYVYRAAVDVGPTPADGALDLLEVRRADLGVGLYAAARVRGARRDERTGARGRARARDPERGQRRSLRERPRADRSPVARRAVRVVDRRGQGAQRPAPRRRSVRARRAAESPICTTGSSARRPATNIRSGCDRSSARPASRTACTSSATSTRPRRSTCCGGPTCSCTRRCAPSTAASRASGSSTSRPPRPVRRRSARSTAAPRTRFATARPASSCRRTPTRSRAPSSA